MGLGAARYSGIPQGVPPASRICLDWPKDAVFACSVTAMHLTGIAQTWTMPSGPRRTLPDDLGGALGGHLGGQSSCRPAWEVRPDGSSTRSWLVFQPTPHGGGGGIRTHGDLATTTVFETVRFVHSRTPPTGLSWAEVRLVRYRLPPSRTDLSSHEPSMLQVRSSRNIGGPTRAMNPARGRARHGLLVPAWRRRVPVQVTPGPARSIAVVGAR